jgi:hypothetical protein
MKIVRWLIGLYVVLGIITLVYQIPTRYSQCSGVSGCGLSTAKNVVWSAIWPVYWSIQRGLLK